MFKADDRTLLKNWRPISLLCVNYKIGSRVIAGRLLRVIDKIVYPDQSAGAGVSIELSGSFVLYP